MLTNHSTAASVSSVGTSPQQAITTSGSHPLSLLSPFPNADPRRAMLDGLIHREPLRRRLLAGHDDVHVVAAPQAVVGHGQQRVRVRRQIDADDLGLLVDDMVDEARVLMAKPVVVLPPNVRAEADS